MVQDPAEMGEEEGRKEKERREEGEVMNTALRSERSKPRFRYWPNCHHWYRDVYLGELSCHPGFVPYP